jgi:hypothetical protein
LNKNQQQFGQTECYYPALRQAWNVGSHNIETMKFKTTLTLLSFFYFLAGHSQDTLQKVTIDSSLAKKISIDSFCLCYTSLSDLKVLDSNLQQVEVEEMDLPKNCFGQDSRFENGKGYYSEKFPGIVFQKDQETDFISKIRLTKDYKGNLPDGTPINMQSLLLQDVFKIYPALKDKWGSRGCSNYWSFSNDTLLFYVKIDTTKKPQFPIDEAFYYTKPVEAIDLRISCYSVFKNANHEYDQLLSDPVFFLDSINVTRLELQKYKPTDFATVTVYKDSNAIKLVGPQGKYGAVYIETKTFARNRYWNFFKGKSNEYLKAVPNVESDKNVVYILNGKVLKTNFEADLSLINDKNFIDLNVIDKETLKKNYDVKGKDFGIVIRTNK